MWIDYLKERDPDLRVVEREHGFATWRLVRMEDKLAVYIEEIYVSPSFRKTKLASQMSEEAQAEGKKLGATILLGTVSPSAAGSHNSMLVLIAHGMHLAKSENNLIWFYKELA